MFLLNIVDKQHQSLRAFNSFRLDVHAQEIVFIESVNQLKAIYQQSRFTHPFFILGEGTNVLFTCFFEGIVFINRLLGKQITQTSSHWHIHVASGENWHDFVCWTLANDKPGLENLALIPGSVGGAPVQNIGAYGVEFASFCEYVDVFDLRTGQCLRLPAADCDFGYRDSRFKTVWSRYFYVLAVGLKLAKKWQPVLDYGPLQSLAHPSPTFIFETICQTRRQKLPDPCIVGNAGSFFKNPVVSIERAQKLVAQYPDLITYPLPASVGVKLAAGWLIEQCGLKGHRIGDAGVYANQALIIVNHGQASAQDLLRLAKYICQCVWQKFQVALVSEVRLIGKQQEIQLHEC